MLIRAMILLSSLLACNSTFSYDANYFETGVWVKQLLVVKQKDNWPVARCFKLDKDQRLRYQFSAPFKLKYDLHADTSTTSERTTLSLERPKEKRTSSGNHKIKTTGVYCLNFVMLTPMPQNWNITLRYRID
jgi:hypothetical protein